jgi:ZIP family zinc transporter
MGFTDLPLALQGAILTFVSQAGALGGGAAVGWVVPIDDAWTVFSGFLMALVSGMMLKGALPNLDGKRKVWAFLLGAAAVCVVSMTVKALADTGGVGLLVGCLADGFAESLLLALSMSSGGHGLKWFLLVLASNLPEGFAAGQKDPTKPTPVWYLNPIFLLSLGGTLLAFIAAVVVVHGQKASPSTKDFLECLGGGAVIATVANSMLPKAYSDISLWTVRLSRDQWRLRYLTGLITAVGIVVAVAFEALDAPTEASVKTEAKTSHQTKAR